MIIHGPHENLFYDKDLGPILLSDWYHDEYFDIVEKVVGPVSCLALGREVDLH